MYSRLPKVGEQRVCVIISSQKKYGSGQLSLFSFSPSGSSLLSARSFDVVLQGPV